jgi:hypothetical protein
MQRIASALPEGTMQLFPGAGHLEGFARHTDDYCHITTAFFETHLLKQTKQSEENA